MLQADEAHFKAHGEALFSSHMLDLSEEPKAENIAQCKSYLEKLAPLNIWLEMEIGITGGEEDGVDNTGVDNASLYTQPEDIYEVYQALSQVCIYLVWFLEMSYIQVYRSLPTSVSLLASETSTVFTNPEM
jgi:fructose-bisphosphate aldolase class II